MKATLRSIWIWTVSVLLIITWFPLLAIIRFFDRDPVHYRTGRWFRRLGVLMTKANPSWQLEITGEMVEDPRRPYILVSNHQSFADIPFISHLPWEMKWIAKAELFKVPFSGWMMRLAGDIPVKRGSISSSKNALERARQYLEQDCPVIIFPEGTRSPSGRMLRFTGGAFSVALDTGTPILPIVIEGSSDCLPRNSWLFGPPRTVRIHILPPVSTEGLDSSDTEKLKKCIRQQMIEQLAKMRGVPPKEVDAYTKTKRRASNA